MYVHSVFIYQIIMNALPNKFVDKLLIIYFDHQ